MNYCGKCHRFCEVVDNHKDPDLKERIERRRNREELVRALNRNDKNRKKKR